MFNKLWPSINMRLRIFTTSQGTEVHPLGQRAAPRPQALEPAPQLQLRPQVQYSQWSDRGCVFPTMGDTRGRPKQFFNQNTEIKQLPFEKPSFGQNQLFDQNTFFWPKELLLANTVSIDQNSLFWPKYYLIQIGILIGWTLIELHWNLGTKNFQPERQPVWVRGCHWNATISAKRVDFGQKEVFRPKLMCFGQNIKTHSQSRKSFDQTIDRYNWPKGHRKDNRSSPKTTFSKTEHFLSCLRS